MRRYEEEKYNRGQREYQCGTEYRWEWSDELSDGRNKSDRGCPFLLAL